MKYFLIIILFSLGLTVNSQSNNLPELDKSPLDIAYFPAETTFRNFQKGEKRNIAPKARIIYSRPQKKGREIVGALIPNDKIWRLGANESTEIQFFTPVKISGKRLEPGNYSLFSKTSGENWTFYLSSDLYTWGAYNIDESKFITSISGKVDSNEDKIEALTIVFEEIPGGANFNMFWDNLKISFPISFL